MPIGCEDENMRHFKSGERDNVSWGGKSVVDWLMVSEQKGWLLRKKDGNPNGMEMGVEVRGYDSTPRKKCRLCEKGEKDRVRGKQGKNNNKRGKKTWK